MSPAMLGFCFGVVVGGLGAVLIIGLLLLFSNRENLREEVHPAGNVLPFPPDTRVRSSVGNPALAKWGTLRRRVFSTTRP